ncbi:MAG: hypothetical protein ABI041_10715, partial [Bdellovibrionia bacterium]
MKILSLLRMTVLAASCLGAHSASAVFVRDIGVSQFQDRSHQDRFQIVHSPEKTARFSYFGMFDGHGVQGSAVAAEYAANHLHEKIFSKFKEGVNFTRLLELAFIETDTDICHLTLF